MTEIQLGYGSGALRFAFDEGRYQVLTENLPHERPLADLEIGEALGAPIESPPLEDLCAGGDSVLIVVSDATRASASAQVIHLLVRRLIEVGVSPSDIAIIFATGIHRPVKDKEKSELLTPFIAQRIKTIDHDAYDSSAMVVFDPTTRGTSVELNRALTRYSHVVVTGAVGFHYFAGFTGGRKSICPGLASAQTIEATHMLAMDFEIGGRREGVVTGRLAGNAVHEECERIAALVEPRFSINSVVDKRGRAVRIYAGDWRAAHYQACREYLSNHAITIDEQREIVIVSCGGLPYDTNLIQAHKALDMATRACTDGGTIAWLAQCPEGLGRPDFLKWFAEKNSRALENHLRDAYEVNGQTAWSLLTKAERYRIYLVSELPEAEVKLMRLIPAHSLNDVLDDLDDGAKGFIMPRGAALLPQLEARSE
jgi:nickel-dependent lactate racemase